MACVALLLVAQPPASSARSWLDQFGALAVGTWEAEGSRNVLEWGIGRRVIRSRGYFDVAGEWKQVSEGLWYFDPESGRIRGLVLAIDMPIDRFEYTSTVDGNVVRHQAVGHGAAGMEFLETWTFGDGEYRWEVRSADAPTGDPMMGGVYHRVAR